MGEVTKRRAGERWDSVIEKVWEDIGGNQEGTLSKEKIEVYKTETNYETRTSETLAPRNEVKDEYHPEIYGGGTEDTDQCITPEGWNCDFAYET